MQVVTSLTASKAENVTANVPALISAADIYTHLLRGSIQVFITFLPDILDFTVNIVSFDFPGDDGKWVCVTSAFVPDKECPTAYFINAPGDPTSKNSVALSEFPVNLWCTTSPRGNEMCDWKPGRKKEADLEADQSLDLPRGVCKQTHHCSAKDFDGEVMMDGESVTTPAVGDYSLIWSNPSANTASDSKNGWTFRDKNDFRAESDHRGIAYDRTLRTQLVNGVDRPVTSYALFTASAVESGGVDFAKQTTTCATGRSISDVVECRAAAASLSLGAGPELDTKLCTHGYKAPIANAVMDSTYGKEEAKYCIDGVESTKCHSQCGGTRHWLQLDLTDTYDLSHVIITNRPGQPQRLGTFDLEFTYETDAIWRNCGTHTVSTRMINCICMSVPL